MKKLVLVAAILAASTIASAEVLRVGPAEALSNPSLAAAVAKAGDVIEISAGTYDGDVAVWPQDRLTIRGSGGPVIIAAGGAAAEGKAIWVTKGHGVRVTGVTFSGARSADGNGAGIRHEGGDLTVSHCTFHDNENGILMGDLENADVVVENSEFYRNGDGSGGTHNIYVGRVRSFTLRFSSSHHAIVGHAVKSRAHRTVLAYNHLADMTDGRASYLVDLPDGGAALLLGNVIQQGRQAENSTLVSYGAEARRNGGGPFHVVGNTLVNLRDAGLFIANRTGIPAQIANNLFEGRGALVDGPAEMMANLHYQARSTAQTMRQVVGLEGRTRQDAGFRQPELFDYRLAPGSPAIDAGVDLPDADGFRRIPEFEYAHPLSGRPRSRTGPLDVGAFEFAE